MGRRNCREALCRPGRAQAGCHLSLQLQLRYGRAGRRKKRGGSQEGQDIEGVFAYRDSCLALASFRKRHCLVVNPTETLRTRKCS